MYHNHCAIDLSQSPEWKNGLKYLCVKAREEIPRAVIALTPDQAVKAVEKSPDDEIRCCIAVAWLTASRVGDLLQLRAEDVTWETETRTLTLTFRRGKTIARRGAYSVHTSVAEIWTPLFDAKFSGLRGIVFHTKVAKVTAGLRTVDKSLESRSLRRGSLQHMAAQGVPDDVLIQFSGHTNLPMLHRYLGWGAIGAKKKVTMTAAAQTLHKKERPISGGEPQTDKKSRVTEEERIPRFLHSLGHEAPSYDEFARMDGKGGTRSKRSHEYPLHIKKVTGSIDTAKSDET